LVYCPALGSLNHSRGARPAEGPALHSPPRDAPCLEGPGKARIAVPGACVGRGLLLAGSWGELRPRKGVRSPSKVPVCSGAGSVSEPL